MLENLTCCFSYVILLLFVFQSTSLATVEVSMVIKTIFVTVKVPLAWLILKVTCCVFVCILSWACLEYSFSVFMCFVAQRRLRDSKRS